MQIFSRHNTLFFWYIKIFFGPSQVNNQKNSSESFKTLNLKNIGIFQVWISKIGKTRRISFSLFAKSSSIAWNRCLIIINWWVRDLWFMVGFNTPLYYILTLGRNSDRFTVIFYTDTVTLPKVNQNQFEGTFITPNESSIFWWAIFLQDIL